MLAIPKAAVMEAADLIISRFPYAWAYFCQFRFALAVGQRSLMSDLRLVAPSLEIGINDGSSATIAHLGKAKFTYGGDMPEESTFESKGLYIEPNFDVYDNVVGMDAHEIPFAEDSFNTVVSNDMLSYGLDRKRILAEMARVLAPGGTLFLTETTGNINRYPRLVEQLQTVVPSVAVLDDAVSFYRLELQALGMEDIEVRTWLDHRLCAVLYSNLYRGEVFNPITKEKSGFHEEGLRAIAELLSAELASEDTGDGWQVAIRARNPGALRTLSAPRPICLKCRSELTIDLHGCVCRQCGQAYRSEYGNPYIISDYAKTYSPKKDSVKGSADVVARLVSSLVSALDPKKSVALCGIDKSTRYVIRSLRESGIEVSAIYSDNPLFIGCRMLDLPIRSTAELPAATGLVVSSPLSTDGGKSAARAAGYQGELLVPSSDAGSWSLDRSR